MQLSSTPCSRRKAISQAENRKENGDILPPFRGCSNPENAAGLSIFLGDNLRCKLCAPLRKEMRYFKIFYSIFTCELKPYVKKGEIKGIAVIVCFYTDKLNGRTFAADFGVKRRGKNRRKQTVHSVFRGAFHIR